MKVQTKQFFKETTERAVKSLAQGILTAITIEGATLQNIDWITAISTGAVMAIYSVLTSIVSYNIGDRGTASVVEY